MLIDANKIMKRSVLTMLALPLVVAACTSEEEILTEKANSQYANIPTVETNFNWGADTRLANKWGLEKGDVVGLAWMGIPEKTGVGVEPGTAEDQYGGTSLAITGKAYQNHPLYSTADGADAMLQPKTSIYVGKYFSYLPYDESTVNIDKIKFSVANQDLVDANIDKDAWDKTAAKSIWISPTWTDVTLAGDIDGNNKAGINETFDIYPRKFSNGVALYFDYENNTPNTGNVEIYGVTVGYKNSGANKAVTKFTYAPNAEDSSNPRNDAYWSSKGFADVNGVEGETGVITLLPNKDEAIATTNAGNTGAFFFNALPAKTALSATDDIEIVITSTYGVVTITKPVNEIAYTNVGTVSSEYKEKADGSDDTANAVGITESFVNKLYKNGKFVTEVDFTKAVMNGMHVKDNDHLKKMLNYYNEVKKVANQESKPSETDIKWYLDPNPNGEFLLSLEAIDLLQKINEGCAYDDKNISIQPCNDSDHGNVPTEIVVIGADNEIPNMDLCFESNTAVTLRGTWNWNNDEVKKTWWVGPFNNEGVINVEATNVETSTNSGELNNTALGTINVNSVANWKVKTTNYVTINIAEDAALRVYGTTLTNDATAAVTYTEESKAYAGRIYNYGVLGTVNGSGNPVINNYGYILNGSADAKTYITNNAITSSTFANSFGASNKIGTIELTNATDNVSVSKSDNQGFIKYNWNGGETYVTPSTAVKYNYLVLTSNITFTEAEPEILYLEIAGTNEVVITNAKGSGFASDDYSRLKGFIMGKDSKANIKKNNVIWSSAAYLEGTLYLGGEFYNKSDYITYFGGTDSDKQNIIKY